MAYTEIDEGSWVTGQQTGSTHLSQTVLKALSVLRLLAERPDGLIIAEIGRSCGLSRPSASRLVHTLASEGFLQVERDGRWRLGASVLSLAGALMENLDLPKRARPYMRAIVDASGETAHLGVRQGDSVLYLAKVDSPESIRMHSTVGASNPLHCTALGKALLAWLPEDEKQSLVSTLDLVKRTDRTITDHRDLLRHLEAVRRDGFALDDVENEDGIRCVAAPVFSHEGHPIAAISFSGPTFRLGEDSARRFVGELMDQCRLLSQELGWNCGHSKSTSAS